RPRRRDASRLAVLGAGGRRPDARPSHRRPGLSVGAAGLPACHRWQRHRLRPGPRRIAEDSRRFKLVDVSHDRWMATPTVQELEKRKLNCVPVGQGFLGMSEPMKELMRLVKGGELNHGGNPVARWNADSVEVKRDDADN